MMFHYLIKENDFNFKKYMSEYNVPDTRQYMFSELLQFLDIIGCNTNDFLNVFDEDNQTFVRNMKHFISKRVKKKSNETNSTCDNFLFNENKTGLTQEYYNSELVIEEKKEKENTELKQHLEKMFPFHNLNELKCGVDSVKHYFNYELYVLQNVKKDLNDTLLKKFNSSKNDCLKYFCYHLKQLFLFQFNILNSRVNNNDNSMLTLEAWKELMISKAMEYDNRCENQNFGEYYCYKIKNEKPEKSITEATIRKNYLNSGLKKLYEFNEDSDFFEKNNLIIIQGRKKDIFSF